MNRTTHYTLALALFAVAATVAGAGILLPDSVLYGTVTLNCQRATATDHVTVVARVDGVVEPVGQYRMGARAPLGDRYALQIRMESGADGSAHSPTAARVGDTVHIYVRQGAQPEQHAGQYLIDQMGSVQQLNLVVSTGVCQGDMDEDGDLDLHDHALFRACLLGPETGPVSPPCVLADFDADGDVDLKDWSRFQTAFPGQ